MNLVNSAGALPRHAGVRLPGSEVPRLLVVVDTEEEFDWHAPVSRARTSVSAMRHIGRVQEIFDRFGVVPTYVVDYPVATQPAGFEPLAGILSRGGCTVGAHLHPWVTPPLDEEVSGPNSFMCNLDTALQRAKVGLLCEAIEQHLGTRPRLFKAGRYGLDRATVGVLDELGFETDGSVCPRFDFSLEGGPSFAELDSWPFWLSPRLLELPCTVDYTGWAGALRPGLHRLASGLPRLKGVGVLARAGAANRIMLSPEGSTLDEMTALTTALVSRGQRFFTLSFHSPSVEPGHTPYVRSRQDLEVFLRTLDQFLEFFVTRVGGHPVTSSAARDWCSQFPEPVR